jgi:hypothetical protein
MAHSHFWKVVGESHTTEMSSLESFFASKDAARKNKEKPKEQAAPVKVVTQASAEQKPPIRSVQNMSVLK